MSLTLDLCVHDISLSSLPLTITEYKCKSEVAENEIIFKMNLGQSYTFTVNLDSALQGKCEFSK